MTALGIVASGQVFHSGRAGPRSFAANPAAGGLGAHALPPGGDRPCRQDQLLPADGAAAATPSDVAAVGDICSFALMDVKRHGHPQGLGSIPGRGTEIPQATWHGQKKKEGQTEASLSERAEDGKTELSLMRFSLVHPQRCPPSHSSKFLGHLRGRVQQDAAAWGASSVRSPPSPGILSSSSSPLPEAFPANLSMQPLVPPQDLSPVVPCPAAATASLLASISRMTQDSSCVSPGGSGGQKLAQLPELVSAESPHHLPAPAPSAAAAGTVGRGFSLLPVQALGQPAADTLAGRGEAILVQ